MVLRAATTRSACGTVLLPIAGWIRDLDVIRAAELSALGMALDLRTTTAES